MSDLRECCRQSSSSFCRGSGVLLSPNGEPDDDIDHSAFTMIMTMDWLDYNEDENDDIDYERDALSVLRKIR